MFELDLAFIVHFNLLGLVLVEWCYANSGSRILMSLVIDHPLREVRSLLNVVLLLIWVGLLISWCLLISKCLLIILLLLSVSK
jgi:hypothetical protein